MSDVASGGSGKKKRKSMKRVSPMKNTTRTKTVAIQKGYTTGITQ